MLNAHIDREQVFSTIITEIVDIRRNKQLNAAAIAEDTRLADLGISSLDLAELISNLESIFNVDPFADMVPITSIVDVGSLCDAYITCLGGESAPVDTLSDELRAIREKSSLGHQEK